MKFINRHKEMQKLEEYYKLSQKQLMTVAISGLRRVGKTTLVKEFIKNKKALYFFVYDSKTSAELLREFTEELRHHKIITELETVASWKVFFDLLLMILPFPHTAGLNFPIVLLLFEFLYLPPQYFLALFLLLYGPA